MEKSKNEIDKLRKQIEVLCEINKEINRQAELKPLLETIAQTTARLLDADAVSVMLYDSKRKTFETFAGWKSWNSKESAVVFSVNEGIIGKVAALKEGMLVKNTSDDPDFKRIPNSKLPPIKCLMCVPLLAKKKGKDIILGVINTSRRDLPGRLSRSVFEEQDLLLFEKFADQITAAIQRSHVFEEVRRRSLQLEIINEVSSILSTSLEKGTLFQRALDIMVGKLNLSYGQLVFFQKNKPVYNFNTLHKEDFLPDFLSKPGKLTNLPRNVHRVVSASKDCFIQPLVSGKKKIGTLYLESYESGLFDVEDIKKMLLTLSDQFIIAYENFTLFQEITLSKKKLEELNQMKNELISIVSHDFRSPLTVISAYSELMLLNPNMNIETRKEYLNSIFNQIAHLRRLADGALKITRIESGEMKYHFEYLNFQDLVSKLSDRHLTKHKLRFELEDDLPAMKGDFDKLYEVLDNLVSNAVKYSPDGGDIVISACRKGEFVEIRVKDHGIGIEQEQIGNLFQKYYRIYNEHTKHIRGTGLGLFICRKLVEGHGGRIGVKSKQGKGSVFYFTIPVYKK